MSIPNSDVTLKEYLCDHDAQYRELAGEHQKFEARLTELSSLAHPSEDELIEETVLKKKKLYLKDQMEMIASKYKANAVGH
jgi:uncharacterized protein YdcH (DUF465 family)